MYTYTHLSIYIYVLIYIYIYIPGLQAYKDLILGKSSRPRGILPALYRILHILYCVYCIIYCDCDREY